MAAKKIILLAGEGFSTNCVFHAVNDAVGIHTVIIESPVDKKTFLKRRIKKLGFINVSGQVLFQAMIVPLLNFGSKKRKAELQQQFLLNSSPIPEHIIKRVPSVNNDETLKLLLQEKPDLVVVNGTRIISKKILDSVKCRFINMHAGITPKYRGSHGGYWALANKDAANSGVTIHLVDAGIDTGGILYQAIIAANKKDNFTTYPILQLAAGLPLLIRSINDALNDQLPTAEGTKETGLWHHPTIWGYLYTRIFKKIK